MEILGIDIGGSGIKGAPVDVEHGLLTNERHRIPTPHPSIPDSVGNVVAEIVQNFEWIQPIGVTFPAIMKHGVAHSAANVDQSWIGTNAQQLLEDKTGCSVVVLNDADAAGIAEMQFGAGKGQMGTVIILTFGTGIGSAIFEDGQLIPNTEFGHLKIRKKDAEDRASDRIRREKELSWRKWSGRVSEFLQEMEILFSPDLFIFGGGVSKKYEKFFKYLEIDTPIVPAQLRNEAGIVGAATAAKKLYDSTQK